jgi:hypothetical protein
VDTWKLNELEVEPYKPQVLDSESEGRAIVINLPAGDKLAIFDPKERHEVIANTDARLLLVLAPWPGEGHPSNRD